MSLTRKLITGTVFLASLSGCKEGKIPQEIITAQPERYAWIDVNSNRGTQWEAYMREKVDHNTVAWENYQKLVRKGNSQGTSYLPDVDGDGTVYFDGKSFPLADNAEKSAPEELK